MATGLLIGRREGIGAARVVRYRGFLLGVLFYYVADAAWGIWCSIRSRCSCLV